MVWPGPKTTEGMAEWGFSRVQFIKEINRMKAAKDKFGSDKAYFVGSDGKQAHYNRYVEFGTRYMEAHPYIRPAARAARRHQNRIIDEAVAGVRVSKIWGEGGMNVADQILLRTARFCLREMKERVPQPGKSKGYATGNLKDSLYLARIR